MHVRKNRKLCRARKNIAKALSWRKRGGAPDDRNVFRERRAIPEAEAVVDADRVVNGRFKKQQRNRRGVFESQVAHVQKALQLRRQIEIRARVDYKNSRIHEIRLAFRFAGAHAGQQAAARRKRDPGSGQAQLFMIPETENPPGKRGIVNDRVKSGRSAAARIAVARGVKCGQFVARPVSIHGNFRGRHLRVDRNGAAGNRIQAVGSERLIKRVIHVEPAEVPVAGPAQIRRANFVGLKNSHRRGPHEKPVSVVLHARVVLVVVNAKFGRVARLHEILHIKIRDDHLLVPQLETVQAAVGVLFEKIEIGGVVFPAVRVKVSEKAYARLLVDKNKSAKIAGKTLDSRAHRKEIVVGTQIANLIFGGGLLQSGVRVESGRSLAHIDVHDADFAHVEIIHVYGGSHLDAPVDGPERSVSVK